MKKFTVQKATAKGGGWWVMRAGDYFEWHKTSIQAQGALEALDPPSPFPFIETVISHSRYRVWVDGETYVTFPTKAQAKTYVEGLGS